MATIPNAVDLDACDALAGPADGYHMRRFVASRQRVHPAQRRAASSRTRAFTCWPRRSRGLRARSWYWVLVGDGPFRATLQRQISALGLDDRVRLMGRVSHEELHAWYEGADVFVHPTLYEGSSLVTLEAMAHRRPVVATTAGGLPDKVHPGITGWLVEPGDAGQLAAALNDAMSRREHLMALGDAGRALVEREFSWDAVAERTIALYRELTAGSRSVRRPSR